MADWKFYGRREQLVDLERMLNRKRWFFAKVTGRRRIGKTTLIQRAMQELGSTQPVYCVQVPDSEPACVNCEGTNFHHQSFDAHFPEMDVSVFIGSIQGDDNCTTTLTAQASKIAQGIGK